MIFDIWYIYIYDIYVYYTLNSAGWFYPFAAVISTASWSPRPGVITLEDLIRCRQGGTVLCRGQFPNGAAVGSVASRTGYTFGWWIRLLRTNPYNGDEYAWYDEYDEYDESPSLLMNMMNFPMFWLLNMTTSLVDKIVGGCHPSFWRP